MTKLIFCETSMEDLELLVKMRMDFILDLHPSDNPQEIKEAEERNRAYLKRLIEKNGYIGFVGFIDVQPVCCSGLLLYHLPPLIGSLERWQGHVLNFFTYPEHRGKGYGKALMEFMITAAKAKGINRLFLNATSMGEPVYRKCGFVEPEEKAMIRYV